MQKRVIILFLISFVIISANLYLSFIKQPITGETTAQGRVYITVATSCGDGSCNGGEICSTCAADCGSCPSAEVAVSAGGGGGGSVIMKKKDFSVNKAVFKVMVRQGESFRTGIVIENTEKERQAFNVKLSKSLEEMVFLSDSIFSIEGESKKEIFLTFVSTNETSPDVYTGNLEIKNSYVTKKIPIIFSVKSKMVLFDISLDIPAKYKEVYPGDEILLQITIFNLGEVGKTDVNVKYIIKDFEGDIISEQSEIIGVETQASSSVTLKLPSNIKPGDYVAIAQSIYDASAGSSSAMFKVKERIGFLSPEFFKSKEFIIGSIIFVFIIFLILFFVHERRKLRRAVIMQSREISNIQEKIKNKKVSSQESGGIKQNLKKKLLVLDKAKKASYISKESYIKGRERIKKLLKKL